MPASSRSSRKYPRVSAAAGLRACPQRRATRIQALLLAGDCAVECQDTNGVAINRQKPETAVDCSLQAGTSALDPDNFFKRAGGEHAFKGEHLSSEWPAKCAGVCLQQDPPCLRFTYSKGASSSLCLSVSHSSLLPPWKSTDADTLLREERGDRQTLTTAAMPSAM